LFPTLCLYPEHFMLKLLPASSGAGVPAIAAEPSIATAGVCGNHATILTDAAS
jgi:hypothetical protein